jgi:hypothetical protein
LSVMLSSALNRDSSDSGYINLLYANIGRGHPFYLDGLLEAYLKRGRIDAVRGQADVIELSTGTARWGWVLARWLYKRGSSGGFVGSVYRRIRTGADYNRPSLTLKFLSRDIRDLYLPTAEPLIVSHPILVAALRGKKSLIYQHGEVVAPREAVVSGAAVVLVPTDEAAVPFLESGYDREQVFVSGLCIEPQLVRQAADCFNARLSRINGTGALAGAFYSSGAEPRPHVDKLAAAAASVVRAGGRAIIFAGPGDRLARRCRDAFRRHDVPCHTIDAADPIPGDFAGALLVRFATRREENLLTARLFPLFDFLVAPSHERTNWALGLGLPMFIAAPMIGPFAPLNCRNLLDSGTAEEVPSVAAAEELGSRLHELRTGGALDAMSRSGWGRWEITGFERIVDFLTTRFGKNA